MGCPNCGNRLQDGQRFCGRCGADVRGDEPEHARAARSGVASGGAGWAAPACPSGAPGPGQSPPGADGLAGAASPWGPEPARWGMEPSPFGPGASPGPAASSRGTEAGGSMLGSWGARVGAFLIDALVLAVPTTALLVGVSLAVDPGASSSAAPGAPGWAVALVYAVLVAIPAAYFTILTGGSGGQTVGGLATGLVVRDVVTGGPLGYRRALARFLVRALLYAALVVPGVLNDLMPLWDPMHQSLSDKVSRALVVRPVTRGG